MKCKVFLKNFLLSNKFLRKIYHTLKPEHRKKFLLDLMPKDSVCAEIGVYEGDFSARILDVVKPKKLHLIDPWKYEPKESYTQTIYDDCSQKIYANFKKVTKRLKSVKEVSIHRKRSEDACKDFPDNYFDWVYIDGNHKYEFVKKDLELYYKKVKKGGFITGDDYRTDYQEHKGVAKAVDEFVKKGLVKVLKIKNNQFILQK